MTHIPHYYQHLLDRLQGVQRQGGRLRAFCPHHQADGATSRERRRSLSIWMGDKGNLMIGCWQSCTFDHIRAAIGAKTSDFFPPETPEEKRQRRAKMSDQKIVKTYDYYDRDGKFSFQVVRMEPKGFYQRRPDPRSDDPNGKRVWINNLEKIVDAEGNELFPPIKKLLYKLPELLAAPSRRVIFIVEGEKDVENLMAQQLVATCNVGGALKWRADYAEYFKDRIVVVIPDNDPIDEEKGFAVGNRHAMDIVASIQDVVASVKLLRLPGLPSHGDVSDWLAAGNDRKRLRELIEACPELASNPHEPPDDPAPPAETQPAEQRPAAQQADNQPQGQQPAGNQTNGGSDENYDPEKDLATIAPRIAAIANEMTPSEWAIVTEKMLADFKLRLVGDLRRRMTRGSK